MKKLLVVCGPTATGKTETAAKLAKIFNGELVSADSRQVYRYMDIGTGKDRPEGVVVHGYDLVNPDEDFSVSQYINFASNAIGDIHLQNKLPILVGGTGFYINAVVDGIQTVNVPRDEKLRKELSLKSAAELADVLKKLDIKKFNSLNDSDNKNPRRLIRAIEIVKSKAKINNSLQKKDCFFVGLTLPKEILNEKIKKRVNERIEKGFEKEIEFLKKKGLFKFIASATPGYKDWPDIERWKAEEIKYAKRQKTWFKKDKRINWIDASRKDYFEKIEKLVRKWHNT